MQQAKFFQEACNIRQQALAVLNYIIDISELPVSWYLTNLPHAPIKYLNKLLKMHPIYFDQRQMGEVKTLTFLQDNLNCNLRLTCGEDKRKLNPVKSGLVVRT